MSDDNKDTPQEGVDTGSGRPEWLPDQFKDPTSLVKSYEESRKEMDRLRSQLDEERTQFAAALERIEQNTTPAPQTGYDPQTNQLLAAFQQAVENQDAAAMLSIQLALNQQATAQVIDEKIKGLSPQLEQQQQADRDIAFQIAQDRVARQYGDNWQELAPEVNSWLHEHASWLPTVNSPDAFEQVIREGVTAIEGRKAAEALAALEADRAAKLSAATATASGGARFPTATDEKKQAWDAIKGADIGSYSQIAGT